MSTKKIITKQGYKIKIKKIVSIKKISVLSSPSSFFSLSFFISLQSISFHSTMSETIPDTSTKRVKTISAFSTFGGSWKTTAVATLAIKMADTCKNVGVVDLCTQGNLTHFFAERSKLFSFDQLFKDANVKSSLGEKKSTRSFIDISENISAMNGITASLASLPELGITIQERYQPDDRGHIQLMSWSPFQENFLQQLESETQSGRPADQKFYSVFIHYIFQAFATKYDLDYIFVDLPRENNAITRSLIMRSDLVLFTVPFKTNNTFMATHTLTRMNEANKEHFTNRFWQPVILPVFTGKTEYDPWDMNTVQSVITTQVSDRFMVELRTLWRKRDKCEFPEHMASRYVNVIHFDESFVKEELGTTCFDQATSTSDRVRDDYDALIKKMIRLVSS